MDNSPVLKISDPKADAFFIVAAISLTTNSVITNLLTGADSASAAGKIISVICYIVLIATGLASYIATIKGFGIVSLRCMCDENNANYYLGAKLKKLSIGTVIASVVLTIVTSLIFVIASQYTGAETLTSADRQAYDNLLWIVAIVSIVMVIFDITLPYLIYLWNIHKLSKGDNTALMLVIIMVVQIVIVSLNSVYAARGSDNSFLATFATLLDVVEGIALMLFFIKRRKQITE